MVQKGGIGLETVLLFYAIFGKLIVRPQAFPGVHGDGPQASDQQWMQSHDRLILVDRRTRGQAKMVFNGGPGATPRKFTRVAQSLELIG